MLEVELFQTVWPFTRRGYLHWVNCETITKIYTLFFAPKYFRGTKLLSGTISAKERRSESHRNSGDHRPQNLSDTIFYNDHPGYPKLNQAASFDTDGVRLNVFSKPSSASTSPYPYSAERRHMVLVTFYHCSAAARTSWFSTVTWPTGT